MAATADHPEGPYTKYPLPLHSSQDLMVWKENDGIGSFGNMRIRIPPLHYLSKDGLRFKPMHPLELTNENNKIHAGAFFRKDFSEGDDFPRPTWGICMGPDMGFAGFEVKWPE